MSLSDLSLGLGKESEHSMKMFAPKEEEKFATLPDCTLSASSRDCAALLCARMRERGANSVGVSFIQ
jgi:hypothetical protein